LSCCPLGAVAPAAAPPTSLSAPGQGVAVAGVDPDSPRQVGRRTAGKSARDARYTTALFGLFRRHLVGINQMQTQQKAVETFVLSLSSTNGDGRVSWNQF
jgi:hypothetical protein